MARRKKQAEAAAGGDFMMLFTALMLILLAFFILLKSMAVVDDRKAKTAIGSLHNSFTSPYDGFLKNALESLRAIRSDADGESVLIEDLIEDLEGSVQKQGLGVPGDVKVAKGGFYPRLTVANHVLYQHNGTEIAPRAFPVLDRISQAARDLNSRVVIESHTATGPLDDPRHRTRWELSAERAANLERYFTEAAGLPSAQVEAEGVADARSLPGKASDRVIITLQPHPPPPQNPPPQGGGPDTLPPEEQPADGQPTGEQPADGQPTGEQPANGQPTGEQPANGQPNNGAPAAPPANAPQPPPPAANSPTGAQP
jgi:chemotaxis protein MotB